MDSETIIVGFCCLFLAILFFIFRSQIFILLNRLAKIEFRGLENLRIKTEPIAKRDTKSFTGNNAWMNFLLHPNYISVQVLLSEEKNSFKQACVGVFVVAFVYQFFYSIIFWIYLSYPINITSIFNLIKECLLVGLFFPAGIIILAGLIHIAAKLFGSKGVFQKFYILYIAYNTRPALLYTVMLLVWIFFEIKAALYLSLLFSFYLFLVPITLAIKENYRFHWIGAFLIGFFVQALLFLSFMVLFIMLNPSIIKQ